MFNKLLNIKTDKYISVEESNAIKGILILLIILGHCHYLVPIGGVLYSYLYRFHVVQFFILPFFYNRQKSAFSLRKLRDTLVKFYVPYFIFFSFCTFIYLWSVHDFMRFDIKESIIAFFKGNQQSIAKNTGFAYLWFPPVFCAFSLIKNILDNIADKLKIRLQDKIIFTLSLLSVLLFIIYLFFIPKFYSSFFILHALHFLTLGFIVCFIAKIPLSKYAGTVTFIFLSILFFRNFSAENINFFLDYPSVLQICFFLFLLSIKQFIVHIPCLQKLGKISFSVYLVHVVIYNVLERFIDYSVINSIVIYLLTVLFSVLVSWLINKITCIRKLVFPKSYDELKSCFSSLKK